MFDYSGDYESEKAGLKVVIFGSYENTGRKHLENLRTKLQEYGYRKASLVKDLPDPPGISETSMSYELYATKKSKHWIRMSDVNLFVLFNGIPYGSVMVEIVHFLTSFPDRIPCSSFLIEKELDLQTLEIGNLRDHNCNLAYFDNIDDLKMLARSQCLMHLLENKCKMDNQQT